MAVVTALPGGAFRAVRDDNLAAEPSGDLGRAALFPRVASTRDRYLLASLADINLKSAGLDLFLGRLVGSAVLVTALGLDAGALAAGAGALAAGAGLSFFALFDLEFDLVAMGM